MAGGRQFALDVVDGEIPFAHSDGELADTVACGRVSGARAVSLEEAGAEGGVVAELVTEAAERSGGVAELEGNRGSRASIQEVGTEGLVLALAGDIGGLEELGGLGVR